MYNDLDVDETYLPRGEILTILNLMQGQLRYVDSLVYWIAPVLLILLYGLYSRIIEAYFDGKGVIIRRTKGYDLSFMNSEVFKTLAQWFFARPMGDTSKEGFSHLSFEKLLMSKLSDGGYVLIDTH